MSFRQLREREYPLPHNFFNSWGHGLESGVVNQATIYPLLIQDEGMGDPDGTKTNPQNAAFAESATPNTYPDSRVFTVFAKLRLEMTKGALITDGLNAIRVAIMPIMMSFKEDYTAIDELTSVETQDVLEMQTESTDRQGYPLWNNVNMKIKEGNMNLLPATVPGLTTDQQIEGVAFDDELFYDAIKYYTIKGKLKTLQRGLKWITLGTQQTVRTFNVRMSSKVKAQNPYTFFGLLVYVPSSGNIQQTTRSADTTDTIHVFANISVRFLEWNPAFDHRRV